MKIALAQYPIGKFASFADWQAHVATWVAEGAATGAHLLVFPEYGAMELTSEQLAYAASDVLYLHALWAKLEAVLIREGRLALAEACFAFLPTRGRLDLLGYEAPDVFAH